MSIALIREHYDYHRWANRRLFDLASGLGDGVTRDMGAHWSFPTLKGMFVHIYGADNVWLTRWKGSSPSRLWGDADFASMTGLRASWDAFEARSGARQPCSGALQPDLRGSRSHPARALPEHGGQGVPGRPRGAAPARGQPRDPPSQRGRDHDHPDQRLATRHRDQYLPHRRREGLRKQEVMPV